MAGCPPHTDSDSLPAVADGVASDTLDQANKKIRTNAEGSERANGTLLPHVACRGAYCKLSWQ